MSSNPPYVEPFFTDTLGSEIFGQPRSQEPETYDGLYDEEEVDADYINYGRNQPAALHPDPLRLHSRLRPHGCLHVRGPHPLPARLAWLPPPLVPAVQRRRHHDSKVPRDRTPGSHPPRNGAPARARRYSGSGARRLRAAGARESPKVSLWSDDDYDHTDDDDRQTSRQGQTTKSAALAGGGAADRAPVFPVRLGAATPRG